MCADWVTVLELMKVGNFNTMLHLHVTIKRYGLSDVLFVDLRIFYHVCISRVMAHVLVQIGAMNVMSHLAPEVYATSS